jgi:hypothetical protein
LRHFLHKLVFSAQGYLSGFVQYFLMWLASDAHIFCSVEF